MDVWGCAEEPLCWPVFFYRGRVVGLHVGGCRAWLPHARAPVASHPPTHPPTRPQDYGLTKAYIFAAMMWVAPVLGTLAAGQSNRLSIGTQIMVRAELTASIYRKALRLRWAGLGWERCCEGVGGADALPMWVGGRQLLCSAGVSSAAARLPISASPCPPSHPIPPTHHPASLPSPTPRPTAAARVPSSRRRRAAL